METPNSNIDRVVSDLAKMAELDQVMREKQQETGEWDNSVDERNTEKLKSIIAEIGWPTISLVGAEASNRAWLIAQHADDPNFMMQCLDLMQKCPEGDVKPSNIAYLDDRIRTVKGQAQIYGTQFHSTPEGDIVPFPIENEEGINERRAQVGLGSFEECQERIRANTKDNSQTA